MEQVLPGWASPLTFTGMAALVVLFLMRGWLVPKSTVDMIVKQKDRAIDERDSVIRELRAQNVALDRRNDLLADQIDRLVSSGYAAPSVVHSQAYQGSDAPARVLGANDPGGKAGAPTGGSQAGGNGKASRRGASRRGTR